MRADEVLAPALCSTSTAIRDPGRHPGASLPCRDRRPVPDEASMECDSPTWAATASGWRDGSNRIDRRSLGPAPLVLYYQILAWFLPPAGVLPPAIITHMFVIEYIFLLWRAASEKAGIGVRAGLPWRTTRTLSKHPGPGSPARQARRNGRPRRDGAGKRQSASACLNVNKCGPVHSRFGSILRFGSSATRIVLHGQKPGFSRGCERHLS